jgi:hypothetical protein
MAKGVFQFGGLWVAPAVCTSRWSDSRRVIEAMIAGRRIPMAIRKDKLGQLLEGAIRKRFSIRTTYILFDELKKALAERVLNAEIDDHLDGEAAEGRRNHRNGYSSKRVITETSKPYSGSSRPRRNF